MFWRGGFGPIDIAWGWNWDRIGRTILSECLKAARVWNWKPEREEGGQGQESEVSRDAGDKTIGSDSPAKHLRGYTEYSEYRFFFSCYSLGIHSIESVKSVLL